MLFLPSSFPHSSFLVWSRLFSSLAVVRLASISVKSSEETLIGSDFSLLPPVSAFRPCPPPPPPLPLLPDPSLSTAPYVPREERRSPARMPEKIFPRRRHRREKPRAPGFLHLFPAARSSISRPPTGRLTPDPFPFGGTSTSG